MQNIENFRKSLQFVLKHEGGFVNNPADKGGPTMWGVTQGTYDDYRKSLGETPRYITSLTADEATDIYSHRFWDVCGCDALAYPLCTVVFDSAVNDGPSRASAWLKTAKDVKDYMGIRKQYYLDLVKKNPAEQQFLRGWLNRLADLQKLVEVTQADTDYDVTKLPDWHY